MGHYEALKPITGIFIIIYHVFIQVAHTRRIHVVVAVLTPPSPLQRCFSLVKSHTKRSVLHKPIPSVATLSIEIYSCSFNCKWGGKKTMRSIVIQLIPLNGIICTQKEIQSVSAVRAQSKYSDPSYRN